MNNQGVQKIKGSKNSDSTVLQYSVKFVNVSTAGKQNLASGVELGGWIPPSPKKRNEQTIIIVENICGPGNIYTHPKEGHLTIRQSRGGGGVEMQSF